MSRFEINEEYELIRKKSVRQMFIAVGIAVVGVLVSISSFNFVLIIPTAIVAIIFFGLSSKTFKEYKLKIIEIFERDILAKHFFEYQFYGDRGIARDVIADTELLSMGNRYYSNDLLIGKYKDVSFLRSDVHIQNETSDGKNTTTVTYFKGQWYEFDFYKNFDVYLQIRDKGEKFFKRNFKPQKFFSKRPNAKRIKLDHPEFNEIYDVYTSDEQQAYYILTPHFMDRLIRFNYDNSGEIVMGFLDNKLFISIYNNTDKFHIAKMKPFDQDSFSQLENDVLFIKEIIDELKLDLDIFK